MSHFIDEHDIDEFLVWLKTQMPESDNLELNPPGPELLELAWQAAQAQRRHTLDPEADCFAWEQLTPLAASDGLSRQSAVCIDSIGGEWSLSRETIPAEPDRLMLRFQCREEFIQEYRDRQIQIIIGRQTFDLGKVDRRGRAESKVSSSLDLSQAIDVRIMERQSGGEETK